MPNSDEDLSPRISPHLLGAAAVPNEGIWELVGRFVPTPPASEAVCQPILRAKLVVYGRHFDTADELNLDRFD